MFNVFNPIKVSAVQGEECNCHGKCCPFEVVEVKMRQRMKCFEEEEPIVNAKIGTKSTAQR